MKVPCQDTETPNPPAASPAKTARREFGNNGKRGLVVQTGGEITKPFEMTQRLHSYFLSGRGLSLRIEFLGTQFLLCLEEDCWKTDLVCFIFRTPCPRLDSIKK